MKKTAYLSDIDLSTLHKKRLDEQNHYKLSCYNRRFYNGEPMPMKPEEHKVKSKVDSSTNRATTKDKANVVQMNAKATSSSCVKATRASNDGNNDIAYDAAANKSTSDNQITNGNPNRNPDFYDEGYFSSPTPNRRRSGTWP